MFIMVLGTLQVTGMGLQFILDEIYTFVIDNGQPRKEKHHRTTEK